MEFYSILVGYSCGRRRRGTAFDGLVSRGSRKRGRDSVNGPDHITARANLMIPLVEVARRDSVIQ